MISISSRLLLIGCIFLSATFVFFSWPLALELREVKYFQNEFSIKHDLPNGTCRRNTCDLVQRMQDMQREVTSFLQTNFPDPGKRWEVFQSIFSTATIGFRYELQPFSVRSDELKYFLEFSDPQSECNFVTLGIGENWNVEKAVRRKYPQCRFLGVDPIEKKNRKLVESEPHSRFVHAAVGDVEGNQDALVFKNRKYSGLKVRHRALTELLKTENKGRLVDFMTIDVEGAEFVLMKELHKKQAQLPIICQLNLEIHYKESHYNVTWGQFEQTLMAIFDEADYVVLNVDEYTLTLRRLFMFNVGNNECVRKFLC